VNKYVLSFFFLLATLSVWGQSKSRVNLISSTTMRAAPGADGHRVIKVHNGVFKQDYSTLTSDSAYFYPDANKVDAFGHVVINQGDTVHIYSDKLNYDGNTKIAVLTDHVIMVDKDATLTTNNFTYNTATRIGTYVNGGKLVNKDNTLTSTNGYYFAKTRDAYFRYDVVCKTPDAVINTDTMRYNSGTRINYFYGPTIIKGKDKDNLYTENGTYNTILKQAAFGKKNLYTSQTKSLKGDSLFYDKLKGYGRAVKHVIFTDTEQKITLLGDLGEYFKSNEEAMVTQNAYMVFVTEDSTKAAKPDATKKDTTKAIGNLKLVKADSLSKLIPGARLLKPGDKKIVDSLVKNNKATVDSLTKAAQKLNTKDFAVDKRMSLQGIKDSLTKQLPPGLNLPNAAKKAPAAVTKIPTPAAKKPASTITPPPGTKTFTSAIKTAVTQKPAVVAAPAAAQPYAIPKLPTPVYRFADTAKDKPKLNPNIRYDSLFMAGDTFKTRMITYKDFKLLKQRQYELAHPDTTIKKPKPGEKPEEVEDFSKPIKFIKPISFAINIDTAFKYRHYFDTIPRASLGIRVLAPPSKIPAKAAAVATTTAAGTPAGNKPATGTTLPGVPKIMTAGDSLKVKHKADSIAARAPKELADTARIRIVNVYNNAKIFKSDLQAKADSMFYSSADSTIRMYVNPMIWTQKSQLSGDTINLQMKHKKLDNLDMFPSGFIVNLEKNDSTTYNQAGGKFMHGQFKNGKLNSFTIIGNAETIYFKRDTVKNIVTDMSRTQSGRAYFNFDNGEISSIAFTEKYTANGIPIGKAKEEDKKLKGFIWKPQDRPASKAAILSHRKPKATVKKGAAKLPNAKKPNAAVDSSGVAVTDSLTNKLTDSARVKPTDSIKVNAPGRQSIDKRIEELNKIRKQKGQPLLTIPGTTTPKAASDTLHTSPALKPRTDSVRRDTSALKKLAPAKPN
jgi:lipopolysaccharide export system protein LptA